MQVGHAGIHASPTCKCQALQAGQQVAAVTLLESRSLQTEALLVGDLQELVADYVIEHFIIVTDPHLPPNSLPKVTDQADHAAVDS